MYASALVWITLRPNKTFMARLNEKYMLYLECKDTRSTYEHGTKRLFHIEVLAGNEHIMGAFFQDTNNRGAIWRKHRAQKAILDACLNQTPKTPEIREIITLLQDNMIQENQAHVAPISFKTALKITGAWNWPDELIFITDRTRTNHKIIISVKDAKTKFDVKRMQIYKIEPEFLCGEYSGTRFTSEFVPVF